MCKICILHQNKKQYINICVGKMKSLIDILPPDKNIATYSSIPRNIVIDFYLTQPNMDGSFLNGKVLNLVPYFKTNVKKIGMSNF